MKKNTRILLLSAMFVAASLITACSPESPATNSNTAVMNASATVTPAAEASPASSDVTRKLQEIEVSDVKQGGKKSNAEIVAVKIEEFKQAYKSDPAKAIGDFNKALGTFNDTDVTNNLLKIRGIAFGEIAQIQSENGVNREREKQEIEQIIAGKINPLDAQLKTIELAVNKNDTSKIPLAFLSQTLVLALLIGVGLGFLMYQIQKSKMTGDEAVSNLKTPDGAAASDVDSGDASTGVKPERKTIVYYPDEKKEVSEKSGAELPETEKSADLSNVENLLGEIKNLVDKLPAQIINLEVSMIKKFDGFCPPISEPPTRKNIEPLEPDEVLTPTVFTPTLVKDLKDKFLGYLQPLEKDKFSDLIIPSYHEKTFLLIKNQNGTQIKYQIIPNKERFRRSDDYYNIQAYFDCDNAGAGELLVEKPALVESEGNGWRLRAKGRISIQ